MAALQYCKPVALSCTQLQERKAVEQAPISKAECRLFNVQRENMGQKNGRVGGSLTPATHMVYASRGSRNAQQQWLEVTAVACSRKDNRRGGDGTNDHMQNASASLPVASLQKEDAREERSGRWRKALAELALACMASAALLTSSAGAALAEEVECAPTSEVNRVIVIASIAEAAGLIGAGVGGYYARKRKGELERLNVQLRQINLSLRRQARVETYAPSLSYAPVAVPAGAPRSPSSPSETIRRDPNKEQLMKHLKAGKKCLRENNAQAAFPEFEKALALARQANDTVEEKKAARGLGASAQRQRKYKDAIGYHELVLKISRRTGEQSGDTEALGAIADCYTELGDLENGAKFYDRYIARLEADDDEQE